MSCQELKFQQCRKKEKASETRRSSHSLSRRACVSLVSPLCSGGAVSTSSMADPASLPLAAVSVSASNSRHSTRKRTTPTQSSKTKAKRPRTRSQDTAAQDSTASATTTDIAPSSSNNRRSAGKHNKHQTQLPSCSEDSSQSRRSSLRNSRLLFDHQTQNSTSNTVVNNKVHNNHQSTVVPNTKNKISVSLIETGTTDVHRKTANKRPQSAGSCKLNNTEADTSKLRRSSKIEPGTSQWDITSSKKSRLSKNKETKSLDAESSIHKYPLRSQVRLSTAENPDRTIPDEPQQNHKAPAINKKKHKVNNINIEVQLKSDHR